MRKNVFCVLLALSTGMSSAFDWKPQSNEDLRRDMLAFAKSFAEDTKVTPAGRKLKKFIRHEEKVASSSPYAWIGDTFDIACELASMYAPEASRLGEESAAALVRKNAFMLLDYPLHVDDRGADTPAVEKEAYAEAVERYLANARARALKWLDEAAPMPGELAVCKIYNMGFLFRTSERTFAIDISWDGTREEADRLARSIDVMFLTHPHADHYSPVMLAALRDAGTPVVLPCDLLPDYVSDKKVILAEDILEPKELFGVNVVSLKGMQDVPKIPDNTYIFDFDGWRIVDPGDNSVRESEARVSEYLRVDIILAACWNTTHNIIGNALKAEGASQNPPLYLPAHQNEVRHHGVNHRESYHELFNRSDRLGDPDFSYPPYMLLDNGENFLLKK